MGISTSPIGLLAIFGLYFIRAIQQPLLTSKTMSLTSEEERATIMSIARLVLLCMTGGFVWITSWIVGDYGLSVGLMAVGALFGVLAGSALLAIAKTEHHTP